MPASRNCLAWEIISQRAWPTKLRISADYTVDATQTPRADHQSDGTRMSTAYGHPGKGRYLHEYLPSRLVDVVIAVYYECVIRGLRVHVLQHR